MASEAPLALPAAVPLLLAAALLVRPLAGAAARAAPLGALPALLVALLAPDGRIEVPWLLVGTVFRLDPASRVFLGLAGAVWLAAGVHAGSYLAGDPRRRAFLAWWSLALAGNAGLVVAGDAGSFYLFFAVMSFASYGLVVHPATPSAVRAGRVYLTLVVIGEVFVFAALALAAAAAGSADLERIRASLPGAPELRWIVAMALVGFGVKAGALGLHVWLPLAHPEAPTPASAVLSAVMVKAGLVGWLALLPEGGLPGFARLALAAGLGAAFYGVAVGLTQRNPKAILAYSTVSQMGLATAGVGAMMGGAAGGPAALALFALHHGLAKGALFLGVGVAKGGGRAGRAAALSLVLPALALAGAPFTSGVLAKGGLKALVLGSEVGGAGAGLLLSLTSVATTLLLAHLIRTVLGELRATGADQGHPAGAGAVLAYAALAAASGALALAAGDADALASSAAKDAWPVALGVGAALLLRTFPTPRVPVGDVLSLYVRAWARASLPLREPTPPPDGEVGRWAEEAGGWAAGAEARLALRAASGLLLVATLAALQLAFGG